MKPAQIGGFALMVFVAVAVGHWGWRMGAKKEAPVATPPVVNAQLPASPETKRPSPTLPSPQRIEPPRLAPSTNQTNKADPEATPAKTGSWTPKLELSEDGTVISNFGEVEIEDGQTVHTHLATGEACAITATALSSTDGRQHLALRFTVTEPGTGETMMMPSVTITSGGEFEMTTGNDKGRIGIKMKPRLK